MKTTDILSAPIESLPGYSVDPDLDPGMAELTTELNGHPFVIRGDEEELYDMAVKLKAEDTSRPAKPAVKAVEVPVAAQTPELASINMSELPKAQIARMKAKSFLYDRIHRTNMLGLLNERIDADRDVAFATKLGLLSVTETYCRKHQKAVSKLRGMDLTS